ncbi:MULTISPECIES: PAS domain S-box protein [Methanocalculus]|uniref:PAS domain S-box protein n=4 Tax=Methanocalculaceae TaxID=1460864 RepID=UPI0020A2045E|nr:PAS domain S-box protein [Methanocalculus sp. AMF5]MCP1661630.1 PAS domain S-box-containing protein [Methanocalculus sp. AMF5]
MPPPISMPISILYVDEEPALLELGKLFLEMEDTFCVTTCTTAKEALDYHLREPFDVIISDYEMPEMNGIDFLQQLRGASDQTPFIILTGKSREEVAICALNSGADLYFQKTTDPKVQFAELSHAIRIVVGKRRSELAEFRNGKLLKEAKSLRLSILEAIPDILIRCDAEGTYLDILTPDNKLLLSPKAELIGKTVPEVVSEEIGLLFVEAIQKALSTQELQTIDYILTVTAGKKFFEARIVPYVADEVLILIRDITVRKGAEARLRHHLRRAEALLTLHRMSGATEQQLLDATLDAGLSVTESPYGFIGLLNPDESVMTIHAWSEEVKDECAVEDQPVRFPVESAGIWGEPVRTRLPVLINDYAAPHPAKHGLPEGHVPISRYMGVPILFGEEIFAVLAVANKREDYLDDDLSALTHLGIMMSELIHRTRSDDSLREREQRFRSLTEHARDIMYRIALYPDVRITYVNPVVSEITGYGQEEWYRKPELLWERIHHDDRHILNQDYSSEPPKTPLITRFYRKNNTMIWFEQNIVPIRDNSGAITAIEGIARDITDIKRAEEEALVESKKRYQSLFESINDGYARYQMIPDHDGNPVDFQIIEANPAFEQVSGLPADSCIGRSVLEVFPTTGRKWVEVCGKTATTGEPQAFEEQLPGIGNIFEVLVYRPQEGECAALFQDITEKKKKDEEIQRSLREKETLIKEIHHRVKNNMQVIASLLMLQKDSIADPLMREVFMESENRVYSIALVHEKLYQSDNLSRIDYGEYLSDIGSHILASRNGGDERIHLEIDAPDIYLSIDRAVPLSLITNELLTNALKHAFPDGREGTIHIQMERIENRFIYRFADDGIGLPDDLDYTNTHTLGLQLVCNLVKQLLGTMTLKRGTGTAFELTFEASMEEEEEDNE